MQIYEARHVHGYEFCRPRFSSQHIELARSMNGAPRASGWVQIEVELITEDRGERLRPSDAPWFLLSALIFRRERICAVADLLLANGELLELSCPKVDLVLFNATKVVDALDFTKTQAKYFSDGPPSIIIKYALHKEMAAKHDIFRIGGQRLSSIHFGQKFVDAWRASGATGMDFAPIWSSDES